MAETTRYHLLPEDNRLSMETAIGDNEEEQLIGPLDDEITPPKKGIKRFKFSYHPTFILRLVVLCLFIAALVMFLIPSSPLTITTIIVLFFAIFRNIYVISLHFLGRWFRINVEVIKSSSTSSTPKTRRQSRLTNPRVQIATDLTLVLLLVINSLIAKGTPYVSWSVQTHLALPACIICWVAIPLYVLSTLDMGKPSRITIGAGISADMSDETDDDDSTAPPQAYRDVEAAASGGLGLEGGKPGAESLTAQLDAAKLQN